jgi:signal peptidase I
LDRDPDYSGWDNTQEFIVPAGHYFMMGDNRDQSNDSRIPNSGVGFVPEENLVGRADLILFSTDGSAKNWEIWKWPAAFRYSRLFQSIE